jgi:hypothetical protein
MEIKSENKKIIPTKIKFKHNFPIMFYNKEIMTHFYSFLDEKNIQTIKNCLKKTGAKETKRKIKEKIKNYVIDFGKNNDKVKYYINEDGVLKISSNIFNFRKEFLQNFTHIKYKDETLNLEQKELYQYLQVLPQNELILSNNDKTTAKICKYIIGYDYFDQSMKEKLKHGKLDSDSEEEKDNEEKNKYKLFYENNNIDSLKDIDFSNKDSIIQRQREILEKMNKINIEVFYPLKLVNQINYWSIILCGGGYFSYALYLRDKELDHKSDHKYVVRKKAGVRQVVKDKGKKIISVGAQIRRANEKKHQENIEMILRLNENDIEKCDCIFIQAPGFNKGILIGENKPLNKYKKKLYNLPFNLPKANYTNICFAFKKLTSAYLEINDENVSSLFK